jgi:hypothetical protein
MDSIACGSDDVPTKNGADINNNDERGDTPLHHISQRLRKASDKNRLEIARILIEYCNANIKNYKGKTALDYDGTGKISIMVEKHEQSMEIKDPGYN